MNRAIFVPAAIALVACVSLLTNDVHSQVPYVPAPVISPSYVVPPPPRQETIVAAPSPQSVWVIGHWDRTPDKWNWVQGTWVKPPFSNAYWLPGYWQHQNGKFLWAPAHWAATNQGLVVAKPVVVPPLYEEVKPAPPAASPALTWQPGHWQWQGTWVWIPGAYIESTVANAVWTPGQWVEGADGSWRWTPAHWSNQ